MPSIDVAQVVKILDDAQVSQDKRGPLLTIAVARAIAYALDLPTQATSDFKGFYTLNAQQYADSVVSQINEVVPLDVESTCTLIRSLWTFRCRLVYQSDNIAVRNYLDSLVRLGTNEVPGYVSELMTQLPTESNLLEFIANAIKNTFKKD